MVDGFKYSINQVKFVYTKTDNKWQIHRIDDIVTKVYVHRIPRARRNY